MNRYRGLALLLLAVSQLVLALDYTIIFVALPSLAEDLGFTANHLQWVISAYSLAFGGFLLIGGRLSDLLGRKRMFMIGMSLFGLGSLLGGLADSQLLLIMARGIQGLGGALLAPATLSLIMSNFEEGPELKLYRMGIHILRKCTYCSSRRYSFSYRSHGEQNAIQNTSL